VWPSAGLAKNIEALKKADWLVVGEIYEDETSEFLEVTWHYACGDERYQNNRLPAGLRRIRRERRLDDEFIALATVEEHSASSSRGGSSRSGHRGPDLS